MAAVAVHAVQERRSFEDDCSKTSARQVPTELTQLGKHGHVAGEDVVPRTGQARQRKADAPLAGQASDLIGNEALQPFAGRAVDEAAGVERTPERVENRRIGRRTDELPGGGIEERRLGRQARI